MKAQLIATLRPWNKRTSDFEVGKHVSKLRLRSTNMYRAVGPNNFAAKVITTPLPLPISTTMVGLLFGQFKKLVESACSEAYLLYCELCECILYSRNGGYLRKEFTSGECARTTTRTNQTQNRNGFRRQHEECCHEILHEMDRKILFESIKQEEGVFSGFVNIAIESPIQRRAHDLLQAR